MNTPDPRSSRTDQTIEVMVAATLVLGTIATLIGLFWPGGDGSFSTTTFRGQEVEIFGQGIYRDNTVFGAGSARGTDLVTLVIAFPVIIAGLFTHHRGSLRGTVLLAGGLVWITYVYSSFALGTVTYNSLFLLYVALLGLGVWGLALLLAAADLDRISGQLEADLPRSGPANFLIIAGLVTALIWLMEPVESLITGEYPELLGVSTTMFTHGFDLAIIVPAALITGQLMRKGHPAGYLTGVPLMMLLAILAPAIAAQTAYQMSYGVAFSAVQLTIMIGGFAVMGGIAIWFVVDTLRHFKG